jgi:hypothetical protein
MYPFKKILTPFLFLLLLGIPVIFSMTLLIKQQIIHYQIDERMHEEILQTITLSSKTIIWIKPGKEVLVNGKLFDVKTIKTQGAGITLTGYFDDKEDILVDQIVKLTGHKNQSGSPVNQPVIKFLFFPVFVSPQKLKFETANWETVSKQYGYINEIISIAPKISVFHPPCSLV